MVSGRMTFLLRGSGEILKWRHCWIWNVPGDVSHRRGSVSWNIRRQHHHRRASSRRLPVSGRQRTALPISSSSSHRLHSERGDRHSDDQRQVGPRGTVWSNINIIISISSGSDSRGIVSTTHWCRHSTDAVLPHRSRPCLRARHKRQRTTVRISPQFIYSFI